jgi:hypothetical protein
MIRHPSILAQPAPDSPLGHIHDGIAAIGERQGPVWSNAAVLAVLWAAHVDRQSAAQIAVTHGATRAAVLGLLHRVRQARIADAGRDPLRRSRLGMIALLHDLDVFAQGDGA